MAEKKSGGRLQELLHDNEVEMKLQDVKRQASTMREELKKRKRANEELLEAVRAQMGKGNKAKKLCARLEKAFDNEGKYERMLVALTMVADQTVERSERLKEDALAELGRRLQTLPLSQPLTLCAFYDEMTVKEGQRNDEKKNVTMNRAQQRKAASGE